MEIKFTARKVNVHRGHTEEKEIIVPRGAKRKGEELSSKEVMFGS